MVMVPDWAAGADVVDVVIYSSLLISGNGILVSHPFHDEAAKRMGYPIPC
jgi:hypothetical protein